MTCPKTQKPTFSIGRPQMKLDWIDSKKLFEIDEFGSISPELNSVYQAGFCAFLGGAVYGGFINSRTLPGYIITRTANEDFINKNQAYQFKSHLDAKRKLQNEFTVSFAKRAFKWGWRESQSLHVGIITLISVYREKSSIYEYLAAGGITRKPLFNSSNNDSNQCLGSLYKTSMGLKGMTAGSVIGTRLGGIAGFGSLGTGTSMQEILYWQYK